LVGGLGEAGTGSIAGALLAQAREPVRAPIPRLGWLLATILALAFGIRAAVIFARFYVIHADETFQYLEQAWRLDTGTGVVPWEYLDGVRSWLLPGVIAALMRVAGWFTDDPLTRVRVVRLGAAALALAPVHVGFRYGQREAGTAGAILAGALCAVWFELIFFAPVVMTEMISAPVALWGIYLNDSAVTETGRGTLRRLVLAGACYALAACLRFQYAPALLGAALWLNRADWRRWRWLLTGGVPVALLAGGVLDTVTLGLPFQSIWLYALRNVWQGVSDSFGVQPWYYYPREMWWLWHAALPLAVFAVAGAVRVPVLALTAAIVVLSHTLTGHKEYRFSFLALAIAPVLIGVGMAWCAGWLARCTGGRFRRAYAVPLLLPPATALSCYAATHDLMARRWWPHNETIEAFLAAHAQPELCGLGVIGDRTFDQGGYTYLGRDVPIYLSSYQPVYYSRGSTLPMRTEIMLRGQPVPQYPGAALAAHTDRFNFLVAAAGEALPGYDPLVCFGGADSAATCLYRRPGNCG
jgi:hypothetical protein